MWVTFAPCLYIFTEYYFGKVNDWTVNGIHALSSVYMVLYPLAVHFAFPVFESRGGLRRGILLGATLNTLAGVVRWFGAVPSLSGYIVLVMGQTLAALGQVFMLAVPPQLAVVWFPDNEINLATALAVNANNIGIAIGCLWSPWAIHATTMLQDIPHLLYRQALMTVLVWLLVWAAFRRSPPARLHVVNATTLTPSQPYHYGLLFQSRNFMWMMVAYGVMFGAQCSIITLIDQLLLGPFAKEVTEDQVGKLSCAMLMAGLPGSILVARFLDQTKRYRPACLFLATLTSLSLLGLHLSIEYHCFTGVALSCVVFGLASYAIAPAIFQYAGELFYPIQEVVPTGYLFLVGNIVGASMVTLMGMSSNPAATFPMRLPLLHLILLMVIANVAMAMVRGPLLRSQAA
ncbi:MFS general substrate transporter [Hesseltinella vesiculosa]|uniref:MFS general substrate transporter n=1 Tax=Hesseltinella vesiculosa TaxID=101127 RepID=A0A1X2GIB0_9FUNG|nr:MFS general substrate transporter [Hesseltinella vesiculosa]